MQKVILVIAAAIIAVIGGLVAYQTSRSPAVPPAADIAAIAPATPPAEATADVPVYPDFRLADLDGVERDFSEWSGKHRLLNFWATWCAPCRREIPLLKQFQEQHGDDGYVVIGIAVDFPEEVAAYAEAAEFNYPILVGQEDAMAVAETSGIEFIGMPFTMIVTADGELLDTHTGEILAQDLEHVVDVIARLESGEIDKQGAREALNAL